MALGTFLQPLGFLGLVVWSFLVLAAAQLTIRLIMAFSIPTTLRGASALTVLTFPVALAYDTVVGSDSTVAARLNWAGVPLVLMGLAGFGIARWVLRLKRTRGQVVAAGMVALLSGGMITAASVTAAMLPYLRLDGAR